MCSFSVKDIIYNSIFMKELQKNKDLYIYMYWSFTMLLYPYSDYVHEYGIVCQSTTYCNEVNEVTITNPKDERKGGKHNVFMLCGSYIYWTKREQIFYTHNNIYYY